MDLLKDNLLLLRFMNLEYNHQAGQVVTLQLELPTTQV